MAKSIKFVYSMLIVIVTSITGTKAQTEADFHQAPTKHQVTKNLIYDFKVDNDFETDDSDKFQKAINFISKNGGGKLIVPKGNYTLSGISMKSNVHIEFDAEVIIRPSYQEKQKNYNIFSFGRKGGVVENVSLTSNDAERNYTIDLTEANNTKVAVFALRSIDNFLFSNVTILDVQSKFSSFILGVAEHDGNYFFPRNGVIKNCTTTNADYGYGLIQSQAAKNVFFKNLGGQGGVTLRLETGETKMNNAQVGGNHDIFAKNIECHDGNAALMISPHAMQCGIVTIDSVTATNCGFGVRIGGGYVAKKYKQDIGLKPGSYNPKSSIKNVTATFGTSAQVKPKHFMYIPLKYQTKEYTADTPIKSTFSNPTSTKSNHARVSVSVAAVGYFSHQDVVCTSKNGKTKKHKATYTIQIDESTVKAIGFDDQEPIIDLTDDVLSECK